MKYEFVLVTRHPELFGSVTNTLRKLFGVQARVRRVEHGARCLHRGVPENAIIIADADGLSGQRYCEFLADEVGHRYPVIAVLDPHHPAFEAVRRMGISALVPSAPEHTFRQALEHAIADLVNLIALHQMELAMAGGGRSRNPFAIHSRPPFQAPTREY